MVVRNEHKYNRKSHREINIILPQVCVWQIHNILGKSQHNSLHFIFILSPLSVSLSLSYSLALSLIHTLHVTVHHVYSFKWLFLVLLFLYSHIRFSFSFINSQIAISLICCIRLPLSWLVARCRWTIRYRTETKIKVFFCSILAQSSQCVIAIRNLFGQTFYFVFAAVALCSQHLPWWAWVNERESHDKHL